MNKAIMEGVLESYLHRVQVRVGNGLSKGMNDSLRTYPMIPDLIRAAALLLARTEMLFGGSEVVRIRLPELFQLLLTTEENWTIEVPVMNQYLMSYGHSDATGDDGSTGCGVRFLQEVNRSKTSLPAFAAAITIGRRIGVFARVRGVSLSPELRKQLNLRAAA